MLTELKNVIRLVEGGKRLMLAAEESLLRKIPKGEWIGGTIPYFMSDAGGTTSRDRVFVEEMPASARGTRIEVYDEHTIKRVAANTSDNGYTVLILPAFSAIHEKYALDAVTYQDMFLKVVAGWISGVHFDDVGRLSPQVVDGRTGNFYKDQAVAMHIDLPASQQAQLGIVNIFEPGDGDELEFPTNGFTVDKCLVGGSLVDFATYIAEKKIDTRLPLVANYMGTHVNVSIQSIAAEKVSLYAPAFSGAKYRFAKALANYSECFARAIPTSLEVPAFSCNCILNYLYGNLEGRRTGVIKGPMTFGEIGYQLLNQTLVYVSIVAA
jgi:hypothetical protein